MSRVDKLLEHAPPSKVLGKNASCWTQMSGSLVIRTETNDIVLSKKEVEELMVYLNYYYGEEK